MKERRIAQRKKVDITSLSFPTLKQPTRGFGLDSSEVSPRAVSGVQPMRQPPLSHDISRISMRPQTKVTVNHPGDVYEQEADKVAQQVIQMSEPTHQQPIQRETMLEEENFQGSSQENATPQAESIPEEEEQLLQTKSSLQHNSDGSLQANDTIESRLNTSKGGGSSLPDDVRTFMEPRFGTDFSQVKVHTDNESVQMNRELGAQAFTHGSNIYYGAGKSPGKNELTAHELTHVIQQGAAKTGE
jgi:hypothetical protein